MFTLEKARPKVKLGAGGNGSAGNLLLSLRVAPLRLCGG